MRAGRAGGRSARDGAPAARVGHQGCVGGECERGGWPRGSAADRDARGGAAHQGAFGNDDAGWKDDFVPRHGDSACADNEFGADSYRCAGGRGDSDLLRRRGKLFQPAGNHGYESAAEPAGQCAAGFSAADGAENGAVLADRRGIGANSPDADGAERAILSGVRQSVRRRG